MLAGVEVWVQAQQQLGIRTDIPAVAVSICCGGDWAHIRMPADEAAALLQLALNCSNPATAIAAALHVPATAAAAARRMPALLVPSVARKLLLTAATRHHTAAVLHMVGLASMQQHINADTREAMLAQLLADYDCVGLLWQLPIAPISTEALVRLLLTAVQGPASNQVVDLLCCSTAAQQFTPGQVDTLLRAGMHWHEAVAAQSGYSDEESNPWDRSPQRVFFGVYELPAICQLDATAVVSLLHAAVDSGHYEYFTALLRRLPAAAALSTGVVASLLQAAYQRKLLGAGALYGMRYLMDRLVALPAFAELSCTDVSQLMCAAIASYFGNAAAQLQESSDPWPVCWDKLRRHPATEEFSIEQLMQPLKVAAMHSFALTRTLSKLPAAQQLSSEALSGI
uniref:Uncharacterized protein n=1 Tax=Tetradesmus obliquus TaxID=3088 RepID=A0A383VCX7_TETOB|eukprot:jgi/Sobl393_1/18208/SZX62226.1